MPESNCSINHSGGTSKEIQNKLLEEFVTKLPNQLKRVLSEQFLKKFPQEVPMEFLKWVSKEKKLVVFLNKLPRNSREGFGKK